MNVLCLQNSVASHRHDEDSDSSPHKVTMPSIGNLHLINYDSDTDHVDIARIGTQVGDIKNAFQPSSPIDYRGVSAKLDQEHMQYAATNHESKNRFDDGSGKLMEMISKRDAVSSTLLSVDVPKTNGKLRIDIRSNEDADGPGVFVFGLSKGSNVEKQGLVHIGDEIIAVNNVKVEGGNMELLSRILLDETVSESATVRLQLRRMMNNSVCVMEVPAESSKLKISQSTASLDENDLDHPTPSMDEVITGISSAHQQSSSTSRHHSDANLPVNRSLSSSLSIHDVIPRTSKLDKRQTPNSTLGHEIGTASLHSIEKRNMRISTTSNSVLEVEVPKTNGKLNIDIRSDTETFGPGLFIYGLAKGSNADNQGILRIGDEIIAVNGMVVDGMSLEDLSNALQQGDSPLAITVRLKIRRTNDSQHALNVSQGSFSSLPSTCDIVVNTQHIENDKSMPSNNSEDKEKDFMNSRMGNIIDAHDTVTLHQQSPIAMENVDEETRSLVDGNGEENNQKYAYNVESANKIDEPLRHEHANSPSLWKPHRHQNTCSIEHRDSAKSKTEGTVFDVDVPKSDGKLKIDIRNDVQDFGRRLFVFSIAPDSNADSQGTVRVGDEVLSINGIWVEGGHVDDVRRALCQGGSDESAVVHLKLRRLNDLQRVVELSQVSYSSIPDWDLPDSDIEVTGTDNDLQNSNSVVDKEDSSVMATTFDVDVPKTNGKLKIDIRYDEDMFGGPGLFVFGFAPGSNAEKQGMLRIGDELLAINGKSVHGGSMDNLSDVIRGESADISMMSLRVKRRPLDSNRNRQDMMLNFQKHDMFYRPFYTNVQDNKCVSVPAWKRYTHDTVPSAMRDPDRSNLNDTNAHDGLNEGSCIHPSINASVDSFGNDLFDVVEDEVPLLFREIEVLVPKTDGSLRIIINEDMDEKGLFVEGFGQGSNAAKQGILQIGDEIMLVNGVNVAGGTIMDIMNAVENGESNDAENVLFIIRRYYEGDEEDDQLDNDDSVHNDVLYDDRQPVVDENRALNRKDLLEDCSPIVDEIGVSAPKNHEFDNQTAFHISNRQCVNESTISLWNKDMSTVALEILLRDMEKDVQTLLNNEIVKNAEESSNDGVDKVAYCLKQVGDTLDTTTSISEEKDHRLNAKFMIPKLASFFVHNIIATSLSSHRNNSKIIELENKRNHLEKMLNSVIALRVKQEMENNKEKKVLEDRLIEANRNVDLLKKNPPTTSSNFSVEIEKKSNSMQDKINAVLEKEKRNKINASLEKEKDSKKSVGLSLEKIATASFAINESSSSGSRPLDVSQCTKNNCELAPPSNNMKSFPISTGSNSKLSKKTSEFAAFSFDIGRKLSSNTTISSNKHRNISLEALANQGGRISDLTRKKAEFTEFSDKLDRKLSSKSALRVQSNMDLETLVRRVGEVDREQVASSSSKNGYKVSKMLSSESTFIGKKASCTSIVRSKNGPLDLEALVRKAQQERAATKRASSHAVTKPTPRVSSDNTRDHSQSDIGGSKLDLNAIAKLAFRKTSEMSCRNRSASKDTKTRVTASRNSSQHFDELGNLLRKSNNNGKDSKMQTDTLTELATEFNGIDNMTNVTEGSASCQRHSNSDHFDKLGNLIHPKLTDSSMKQLPEFKELSSSKNVSVHRGKILMNKSALKPHFEPISTSQRRGISTSVIVDGLGNVVDKKQLSEISAEAHVEHPLQVKVFKGKTSTGSDKIETLKYANGDQYIGTMKNGLKHGRGQYMWVNGDEYVGNFVKDQKCGLGKLKYSNGDVFEGYRDGDKKNGQGKYEFANGCKYDGNYRDDAFHGKGTFSSNEGWVYHGDWFNNVAHGHGKMSYANGDVYVGSFREDMRNGYGTMMYVDGSKYEGSFVDDNKCGKGKITYPDNRVEEGIFDNDVLLHLSEEQLQRFDMDKARGITDAKYHNIQDLSPEAPIELNIGHHKSDENSKIEATVNTRIKLKNNDSSRKNSESKALTSRTTAITKSEICMQISIGVVGDIFKSVVGEECYLVFSMAQSAVGQFTKAAVDKLMPKDIITSCHATAGNDDASSQKIVENLDESGEIAKADNFHASPVTNISCDQICQADPITDDVNLTNENAERTLSEESGIQIAKQIIDENHDSRPESKLVPDASIPIAPTELTRFAMINRPTRGLISQVDLPPTRQSITTVDLGPECSDMERDVGANTAIEDFLSSLLKDEENIMIHDSKLSDVTIVPDEEKVSRFFPKKEKKQYSDIKLGKAITKLLRSDSQNRILQRNFSGEKDKSGPDAETVALIQRIRRELNLPGDKGTDSHSISSELEKEQIDEDIAYVDEIAMDYNSFISLNKDMIAAKSSVDIPRPGNGLFKNSTLQSSVVKNDLSDDLQGMTSHDEIPTPAVNSDWMKIFNETPSHTRQVGKQVSTDPILKKSPYNQKIELPLQFRKVKSANNIRMVGNPCSASNRRGRRITQENCDMKINHIDGTPTLQSTKKIRSGSGDTSFQIFELLVPKTQNSLKIQFSQSSTSKIRQSLTIKAFAPDSNAKAQGVLRINDEILEVNSVPVRDKYIDDVMGIIARDTDAFILLLVRRRKAKRNKANPLKPVK